MYPALGGRIESAATGPRYSWVGLGTDAMPQARTRALYAARRRTSGADADVAQLRQRDHSRR
jgi:hypothetical protein